MPIPTGEIVAIICSLIAAIGSYCAASTSRRSAEETKQREREKELKTQERDRIEKAMYSCVLAVLEASEIELIALKGGHLNGNVERALNKVEEAKKHYSETRDQAITNLL